MTISQIAAAAGVRRGARSGVVDVEHAVSGTSASQPWLLADHFAKRIRRLSVSRHRGPPIIRGVAVQVMPPAVPDLGSGTPSNRQQHDNNRDQAAATLARLLSLI